MMHSVIGHAEKGDPYRIDTLFMFMANMAWNSAMNPLETVRCLTAQDESGDYASRMSSMRTPSSARPCPMPT